MQDIQDSVKREMIASSRLCILMCEVSAKNTLIELQETYISRVKEIIELAPIKYNLLPVQSFSKLSDVQKEVLEKERLANEALSSIEIVLKKIEEFKNEQQLMLLETELQKIEEEAALKFNTMSCVLGYARDLLEVAREENKKLKEEQDMLMRETAKKAEVELMAFKKKVAEDEAAAQAALQAVGKCETCGIL